MPGDKSKIYKVFICQFLVKTHDLKMCGLNYGCGHSFWSSVNAVLTVFSVLSDSDWPGLLLIDYH